MLASIGHDDIQYWLSIKINRDKILDTLPVYVNDLPLSHYDSTITKEYRRKPDYQPEIFIDVLERRIVKNTRGFWIIWEIKPVLANLGEVLRQLRKYRQIMDTIELTILIYNTSPIKHEIIKQYFESEDIHVYKVSAQECPRLEERVLEVCDD